MKKITVLFVTCLMLCASSYAQPAKSVYAELGGPGLASANFDIRFSNSEGGLGGRIGVGGFGVDGFTVVGIPIGINYITSKDERNYFEVGGGFTPVFTNDKTLNTNGSSDNFQTSFGHLWIGYRSQPKAGGFIFRAGVCPVFGKGFFIPYYFGISFGYKF